MNFRDFQYSMLILKNKFKEYKKLKNELFNTLDDIHCMVEDNIDEDGDFEHYETIKDAINNFIKGKGEEDINEIWRRIEANIKI